MPDEQDIYTDVDQPAPAGGEGTVRVFVPGSAGTGTASPMNKKREEQVTRAPVEIGGRNGPDPTRFGDWELKGRCIDF